MKTLMKTTWAAALAAVVIAPSIVGAAEPYNLLSAGPGFDLIDFSILG